MRSRKKGAVRYIVLALVLQAGSRSLERLGDHAAALTGPGQGAGAPYYIPALLLTLAALGLFLFALKRLYDRITGKGGGAVPPQGPVEDVISAPQGFDPDAALQRYLSNRPADPAQAAPPQPAAPARPGGFGRKGL